MIIGSLFVFSASLYDAKRISEIFIINCQKNHLILARNNEKADDMFMVTGANSPVATSIICCDNSIAYILNKVNIFSAIYRVHFINQPLRQINSAYST